MRGQALPSNTSSFPRQATTVTWLGQPRMEKGKRPEENQVSNTSSSEAKV